MAKAIFHVEHFITLESLQRKEYLNMSILIPISGYKSGIKIIDLI